MHHILGALILGTAFTAGARRQTWRPLLKSATKTGIRIAREARARTATLRAEAEKLVGEARADLDHPNHDDPNQDHPNPPA